MDLITAFSHVDDVINALQFLRNKVDEEYFPFICMKTQHSFGYMHVLQNKFIHPISRAHNSTINREICETP